MCYASKIKKILYPFILCISLIYFSCGKKAEPGVRYNYVGNLVNDYWDQASGGPYHGIDSGTVTVSLEHLGSRIGNKSDTIRVYFPTLHSSTYPIGNCTLCFVEKSSGIWHYRQLDENSPFPCEINIDRKAKTLSMVINYFYESINPTSGTIAFSGIAE